jgi:hypothetical protein
MYKPCLPCTVHVRTGYSTKNRTQSELDYVEQEIHEIEAGMDGIEGSINQNKSNGILKFIRRTLLYTLVNGQCMYAMYTQLYTPKFWCMYIRSRTQLAAGNQLHFACVGNQLHFACVGNHYQMNMVFRKIHDCIEYPPDE